MFSGKLDCQNLLDSIATPVVSITGEWRVVYCNRAFADLIGKGHDEVEDKNLLEICPGYIGTPSYQNFIEVLQGDGPRAVEKEEGGRRLLEQIYRTPQGLISVTTDITSIRRTGDCSSGDNDYRLIFDAVNDAIFIYDACTGDIIDANRTAAEMFGYSEDALTKMNIGDLTAGEVPFTRENVMRWVKSVSDADPQLVEWKTRDSSGRVFWIELKSRLTMLQGEKRMLAVVRDITERKMTQRELREAAERYQNLFDSANDLIYFHDLEGNFLTVNQAAERLTGYWRDELLRMNIDQLVAEEYREIVHGYMEFGRAMASKRKARNKPATYELAIRTRHGMRAFLETSTWLVYKTGVPVGIQGIARDITSRKQEEKSLRELGDRLEAIIEYLPDPTMVIDVEGRVRVWNRAMEELTGVRSVDMLGKGDYHYALPFYGEKRPILVDLVARPDEVKKYYSVSEHDNYVLIGEINAPCLKDKGHILWGKATPIFCPRGSLLGAVESIRDITESKAHEKALERGKNEAEKYLRAIVFPEGDRGFVATCDDQGLISYAQGDKGILPGIEIGGLPGRFVHELVAEEDRERLLAEFKGHMEGGSSLTIEVSLLGQGEVKAPGSITFRTLSPGREAAVIVRLRQ